jgi:hypothetical protein
MPMLYRMTIAAAIILQSAAAAPATAASFDGAYRGTLNCAKLSWTKAPLSNEPVSIAIMDGKVSYSRVLYGVDRSTVVGQESGSGTIEPDGTIALTGGSAGRLGTMKATYKGKIEGGAAILNGAQSVIYQGKTEIRACTLQLKL